MAGIIGRMDNGDILVELCGKSFPMSKMTDVQFADWVRICVGLRPLSCGDDSRGRRNGKAKLDEVDPDLEAEETEDEEPITLVEAAEPVRADVNNFVLEPRQVMVEGRMQVMQVKVYK